MNAQLPSRRLALAGVIVSLALTGCSSTKESDAGSGDAKTRYAQAQTKFEQTPGYHIKVVGKGLPNDGSFLQTADGDVVTNPASFAGKVGVLTSGQRIDADVINIGAKSWVKQGTAMKNYMEFNTSDFGVPNPSALFSAKSGIPALPAMSKDLKETGQKLVNGEKVTMFKGSVEANAAAKAMSFGTARSNYTVEVGLTGSNEVRTMTVSGPFFDAADGSYTLDFSNFGQKKTISQP